MYQHIRYIVRQLEGHYSTLSSMELSILWSQSHCKFWPILLNFLFCFIYVAIKTTFSAASNPKDKFTILLLNVNFISRTIHQPCRMYKEIYVSIDWYFYPAFFFNHPELSLFNHLHTRCRYYYLILSMYWFYFYGKQIDTLAQFLIKQSYF